MRKLWRWFGRLAFLFAVAADAAAFYYAATPVSVLNFFAAGLAAVILYAGFALLAGLVRGRSRLRKFLERDERKVHETGLHWIWLLREFFGDKSARRWAGIPLLIALVATVLEFAWFFFLRKETGGVFASLPRDTGLALVALYIPLLVAIPKTIDHIANWISHRYVITPLRVINQSGIFSYHMHGMMLARVVDVEQDYTFWQQVLNYGDVVFRETAGQHEVLHCVWGPKRFAKIATRQAHGTATGGHAAADGDSE